MPIVSNRHRIPESIDIGKDIRRVSVFIRGVVEEFRNGLKKDFMIARHFEFMGITCCPRLFRGWGGIRLESGRYLSPK